MRSPLHPPRHDKPGDEHLDDFAELVAGLTADGDHAAVRPGARRPQFEDFALDVEHGARPDRGMATVRSETRDQFGEVVQVLIAKLVVPRRTCTA